MKSVSVWVTLLQTGLEVSVFAIRNNNLYRYCVTKFYLYYKVHNSTCEWNADTLNFTPSELSRFLILIRQEIRKPKQAPNVDSLKSKESVWAMIGDLEC